MMGLLIARGGLYSAVIGLKLSLVSHISHVVLFQILPRYNGALFKLCCL